MINKLTYSALALIATATTAAAVGESQFCQAQQIALQAGQITELPAQCVVTAVPELNPMMGVAAVAVVLAVVALVWERRRAA